MFKIKIKISQSEKVIFETGGEFQFPQERPQVKPKEVKEKYIVPPTTDIPGFIQTDDRRWYPSDKR